MKKWFFIIGIGVNLLIVVGLVLQFFVNINTLKEQRMRKQLENVPTK
ncbi:hypothetical protein SAMN04515674_104280 [Pseudarcicella hirudinis]|uniref:Uncharacterized protein n=1 Tax=Pseudarcicella hirudinis TaxID=1079859 RepID=A0A1I5RWE1_9BACT|nr:hypothetical protein [Pseudarcicella hirudinis]SFP62783.1 hypothetical protein SAMN04515674_104280 [Pseudarcicella hirudinis]